MLDPKNSGQGRSRQLVESLEGVTARSTESLAPDPDRLIFALRQIGYSIEQALADLVDNSINAGASTVLIRFTWDRDEIKQVVVADNGCGMTSSELRNAMRFGSDTDFDPHSLGKFGMGLKLASFSHARRLTVVSRRRGRATGRRWTLDGIGDDWSSELLRSADSRRIINSPFNSVALKTNGTIVIWDDLDKLPTGNGGLRHTLRAIHRRLQLHLGLCFHRFLWDGRLHIRIDQQQLGEAEHHIQVSVPPLDPFAYVESGKDGYPKLFDVQIEPGHRLEIEGHIWPPNSETPEYRMGNRVAASQGFYFYRNDRLIQAGGWNGLVQNESEPHGSLARVKVDMPPELDTLFSLNVQKSSVIVPPGFVEAVAASKSADHSSFELYRHDSHEVYRKTDVRASRGIPTVPGRGIPVTAQRTARGELAPDSHRPRQVDFVWTELDEDELFRFDRDKEQILLNETYRGDVLRGLSATGTDVPVLKMLIYFLLESDMNQTGSLKRNRKLQQINRILTDLAELQKG